MKFLDKFLNSGCGNTPWVIYENGKSTHAIPEKEFQKLMKEKRINNKRKKDDQNN